MPKGNNRKKYRSSTVEKTGPKLGIYLLRGITGKNQVKIDHITNLDPLGEDQVLTDNLVEEFTINKEECIHAKMFTCNITNHYLVTTMKLPMVYVTVYMDKPLKSGVLYKLVLYFTLDPIDKNKITSQKEFLSASHTGRFTVEVVRDTETNVIDSDINVYPGDKQIREKLSGFTQTEDMLEVTRELVQLEEEKIANKYKTNFDINEMPQVSVSLDQLDGSDIDDYY